MWHKSIGSVHTQLLELVLQPEIAESNSPFNPMHTFTMYVHIWYFKW